MCYEANRTVHKKHLQVRENAACVLKLRASFVFFHKKKTLNAINFVTFG